MRKIAPDLDEIKGEIAPFIRKVKSLFINQRYKRAIADFQASLSTSHKIKCRIYFCPRRLNTPKLSNAS